jgi:dolichol-phosphate mannosyltransferase
VLHAIRPETIRAEGYSFLEETLWRVVHAGGECDEVPITFEDRLLGKSKINRAEIFKGVWTLLRLRFSRADVSQVVRDSTDEPD